MKSARYFAAPPTFTEGQMPDYTLVDAQGRLLVALAPLPAGVTAVTGASGNVANGSVAASLPAVAAVLNYVDGFEVTGAGATGASNILVTLTGVITGTLTYVMVIPAGVNAVVQPLIVNFSRPIPASAVNTAITVTAAAFGAGNTHSAAAIHGFKI